jgi:hypothetical protein
MEAAMISFVLVIVLVLIAIRLISARHTPDEANQAAGIKEPLIHASGIYSIIRKSPREDLLAIRPQETEIRKYLAFLNEDYTGHLLSAADKQKVAEKWRQSMEENIGVVEQGDSEDVEFYYYDSLGDSPCPVCASCLKQGQFISRQEIFKNPSIIPPFHLGCTTRITPYRGRENLRETTLQSMAPFFSKSTPPPVPEWTTTIKLK